MKRLNKVAVASKFNILDLHDDALKALKVYPPRSKGNFTRIDFELRDDSTGVQKVVSFHGCANFRFVVDFDVLADNWPFNTKACTTKTDAKAIRKFVQAQVKHWRTTYMSPSPKNKPVRRKLESVRSYILFRVAFFGGTADILAKHYRLKGQLGR